MAAEQEKTNPIILKIDKNFAYNFDILQNIKVGSRKSSQGFSDGNKLMISMRDGTTRVGNQHSGGNGTSGLYFFTDFLGTRHTLKGYNNRVWDLKNGIWTDLGVNFSGNNFNFNTVKLPINIDGTTPTTYTTPADATQSEAVKIDASDTGGSANIGKIILIISNSGDNNVYRGAFGTITSINTDTNEYILGDSGIFGSSNDNFETIIGLKSGSTYKIYDTIGEYLQVSNGVSLDRYFFGKNDGLLYENTSVQGFATYGLRNVNAILSTQYLVKQINYSNSYVTFNKGTLFYTSGNINNPFFYTYVNQLTVPGTNGGYINDLFEFKGRLIIAGNNFCKYINSISDLTIFNTISNLYGIKEKSLIDLGVDSYFLSTNRQIYSLSETIQGTLLATNVGQKVDNYINNFYTNICAGFDGRKLYYYGQIDSNTAGIMVVLDIEYKFWSIYTGLRPSSIVVENGITYLSDNNSDIVRYFDSSTNLDVGGVKIEQKIAFNEITLNDVFSTKIISDNWLWLDNYNQELYLDIYVAGINYNSLKQRTKISISEVDVITSNLPMGEGDMGENILGGQGYTDKISYPFLKHIVYDGDSANILKIVMTGKDGSPFYLNEFISDIKFEGQQRLYFSSENTY